MARTRVRTRRLAPTVVTVAVAVVLAGRTASGAPPGREAEPLHARAPEQRYVVRSGDTVWGIARARVGPEGDPRPVVAEIRRVNGLEDPTLRPGMALRLPAP